MGAVTSVDRQYQAEDDHRTLLRAAEVRADQKRMVGVAKYHRTQMKAFTKLGRSMLGRRAR